MTTIAAAPTPVATSDELELARRIGGGDRVAFEALMRRHNRQLFRLACATLRDASEVEDALQDAYLKAWRAIAQFRGEAALSTWLSRLVYNECAARMRRHVRRQQVLPMVPVAMQSEVEAVRAADADLPDELLARGQLRHLLARRLDALPERFRAVFVLREVEEMSVQDTALCLAIPEATVRSRHFRARGLLRLAMARELDHAERELYPFGGQHCDRVVAMVLARLDD
jgi:RNA polymerase sigma-70 factor (ECF subfamily)